MAYILILDDSVEIVDTIITILSFNRYVVAGVQTKKQLYEQLQKELPSLLIMDVLLANDNGKDLCRALKNDSNYAHIPIILMSGHTSHLLDYAECKANAILEKPFDLGDILGIIKKFVQID